MFQINEEAEKARFKEPGNPWTSERGEPGGCFQFLAPSTGRGLRVVACDGSQDGWEHVSVSLENRTPNWAEMCFIKNIFWDEDDAVIQYHPAKKDYVNNHEYCLHMWRHVSIEFPTPPKINVGV